MVICVKLDKGVIMPLLVTPDFGFHLANFFYNISTKQSRPKRRHLFFPVMEREIESMESDDDWFYCGSSRILVRSVF